MYVHCIKYRYLTWHAHLTEIRKLHMILVGMCIYCRATASTKMNDVSSRSHAIFTIIFTQVRTFTYVHAYALHYKPLVHVVILFTYMYSVSTCTPATYLCHILYTYSSTVYNIIMITEVWYIHVLYLPAYVYTCMLLRVYIILSDNHFQFYNFGWTGLYRALIV